MSDKYLNIDLNDPRASAIADVMGNKTAKKMLDIIAEKEVSESDIANQLKIPLNTVGYNIDKLLKAGLIEKTSNFFWSVKGKKIPTYKLSNKKILISPKRLTSIPIAMILSILGAIALIILFMNIDVNNSEISIVQAENISNIDNDLKQFSTYAELEKFLNERVNQTGNGNNYLREGVALTTTSADSALQNAAKSSNGGAESYSETNVQVKGVDEPDFMKNDGKYIYMISGQRLYIVQAYPAEEMKIIANVSLSDYSTNMFLNGDKIVVFSNGYKEYRSYGDDGLETQDVAEQPLSDLKMAASSIMPCYGYRCAGYSKSLTNVVVYDISQRENPIIESNYSFDGSYVDARLIDDYVYLVSQNYVYGTDYPRPLYQVNGVEKEVDIKDIYYSDESFESFAFTSISAISLENEEVETKVYLLSASGTSYVSENNIYLTSQKWTNYDFQIEMKIKEGIIPVMPEEYKDDIEQILIDESIRSYEKEQEVMSIVKSYIKSLGIDEQSDFNKELSSSLENAEIKASKEYQKTVIHKISIDKMNIKYVAEGEVAGYLLNQFSMDEFDDNLRVAVTTGNMWGNANSLNHLFVLDENLEIIGSVEDLAKGERIYSARFMGERAYMVTFRQVDPLYVIDLSNPKNPEVLGYLKVTGYSGYLHPYDENNIIGIGMQANEAGRVSGVKIALFDVSDVANPIEKAKYVIESEQQWSWSSSDAIYEHKAFLFDKEKNLMVLPIQYSYYLNNRYLDWNGVYVFYIDSETIELDKKISHVDPYVPIYSAARDADVGEERKDYSGVKWTKISEDLWRAKAEYKDYEEQSSNYLYGYYNPYEQGNEQIDSFPGGINYYDYSNWNKRIQRSLFMDDTLYTVSERMIKANSLNDFRDISEVEIEFEQSIYDPYISY